MRVELLAYTPEAQVIVASAAKLCYSPADIDEILKKQTPEATEKFIDMLVSMGHESPVEHAYYTFAIENVSRSLLAQITRHRMASFSVQSQRYVREKEFEYIVPPRIKANPEAFEEFKDAMRHCQESYDKIAGLLKEERINELISSGTELDAASRKAEKEAIEDARFVLPNACDTKMIVTMNARSLYNFFNHRCCMRAQWEIRELATEMLRLVKRVSPQLFKNAGPFCMKGACTQGSMSCGKAVQVREKFRELD